MFKKITRFLSVVFSLLFILLIAPFFFKDTIKEKTLEWVNSHVSAEVAFDNIQLSFLSNFPKVQITLNELQIINKAPFKGDTLFVSEKIDLSVSAMQLISSNDQPLAVETITLTNAIANLKVASDGSVNYDIVKKSKEVESSQEKEGNTAGFSLKLQKYTIDNLTVRYQNLIDNSHIHVDRIFHQGSGNFQNSVVALDTRTQLGLGFTSENIRLEEAITVSLDAIFELDLENKKYTFLQNNLLINQLPLEFEGFLQTRSKGNYFDLRFSTPSTSIKHLLGLLPKEYSGDLNTLQTKGKFAVQGTVAGMLTENSIPTFGVSVSAENASFRYPSLPKSVENIAISALLENKTGKWDDTYFHLKNATFIIDQDQFQASGRVIDIANNPTIAGNFKGTVNLSNLSKAYPIVFEKPLKGLLKADVATRFDIKSIKENRFQNIRNQGTVSVNDFEYNDSELANPVSVDNLKLQFDSNQIRLVQLNAKTGNSDLNASGKLTDFYPYLFNNQTLKGNFKLTSKTLRIDDFMTNNSEEESDSENSSEQGQSSLKIPSFLDCTLVAKADTVEYNNIVLKSVQGKATIKNQTIALEDVTMGVFDGSVRLNGNVNTREETPTFAMDMQLDALNVSESFSQLKFLKSIAPIANIVKGTFNSSVQFAGDLTSELTPNLESVSGNLVGELLSSSVDTTGSKLLPSLASQLKFIDLNQLNFDRVKTAVQFKNGNTIIQPFTVHYQDIPIQVQGSHGLDQQIDYQLTMDLPASYLGSEVTDLMSNLSDSEAQQLTVPVTASVGGSFSKPLIKTDLKGATSKVISQLVNQQKKRLVNKGIQQLGSLLGNPKKKDTVTNDSIKKPDSEIKNQAKKLLKGLFD